MSILDNGFTLSKEIPYKMEITTSSGSNKEWVSVTGSLADIQDFLKEAWKEVNKKIEEIG